MRRFWVSCSSAALALFVGAGAAFGGDLSASPPPRGGTCFSATEFGGWRAADAKTIYIRADGNRVFRLDLSRECPRLLWPDAQLVIKARGGSLICSAVDMDVRVSEAYSGPAEPCFAKTMTELGAPEAAAIPERIRP